MKKYACYLLFLLLINMAIPVQATTYTGLKEQLISETFILIDADTGQILFEKDMHRQMRPASITKIMTALLALELGDMDDVITMSHDAVFSLGRGAANIALDTDEELTLEQALYALSIASANDAANGIAELIGGSMDAFHALMNERAREAGALDTNFTNAHGMPDDDHITTAYDMARIMMAAIKTPGFNELFSALTYEMPPTNKQEEPRTFSSRNPMLTGKYQYDGIIAEKTGWTSSSEYTLATAAERNGRTLICIVMKSPEIDDKYEDTTALLEYGFDEFDDVFFSIGELSKWDYILTDADGSELTVNMTAAEGLKCLVPKSLTKDDIEIEYVIERGEAENGLQVTAIFTVKPPRAMAPGIELGTLKMAANLSDMTVPAVAENTESKSADGTGIPDGNENKSPGIWDSILIWAARIFAVLIGLIILLFMIILIMRWINIRRYRRRRGNRLLK